MAKTDYKIPQKLWFIQQRNNNRSNVNENLGNSNLAYLTYLEYTKDGNLSSQTKKRLETGYNWAVSGCGYTDNPYDYGMSIDNEPITGFYIGDSVSRWTTQNKLFRVIDPRGFTIEVSTGNIATMLHYTTVINGYIQEPCVYCYDCGQHFVLPINSELYQDIIQEIANYESAKQEVIKAKDLVIGKMYQMLSGDLGYYLGRFNIDLEISSYSRPSSYWRDAERVTCLGIDNQVDTKVHLYIPYRYSNGVLTQGWGSIKDSKNPQFYRSIDCDIVHNVSLESVTELLNKHYSMPDRIFKSLKHNSSYTTHKVKATLQYA